MATPTEKPPQPASNQAPPAQVQDYRPVTPEEEKIIRSVQAENPGYSRELILRQIDEFS